MKKPIKGMWERELIRNDIWTKNLYDDEIVLLKFRRAIENFLEPIVEYISKILNKI